jgi:hypothetical protein
MANAKIPEIATATGRLDREMAARAAQKIAQGQEPTAPERAALKRRERELEETRRWQYYATIPQKHWRQMSGRQAKVINEQATTYGIPFSGPTVNLPDVVRGFHDFLARNARRLREIDDEMMLGDPDSPALERFREAKANLAELDLQKRKGELVPRDEIREGLGRFAARIRGAGDLLERQFGPEAAEILREALDDCTLELDRSFEDGADGQTDNQQPG